MNVEPKYNPECRIPVGMPVYDKDKDGDLSRLIIINNPEKACREFDVPGTGKTVADFNQDYDGGIPVAQAVYQGGLEANIPDWKSIPLKNLYNRITDEGLKIYSFPAPRLKSATSTIPDTVETYHELICYLSARMTHLSVTMDEENPYTESLMWANYNKRVSGEIRMSTLVKENQYQMKENIGVCLYCGSESETTFDHVISVDSGGEHSMDNMVPVCQSCNSSKSNKNMIDWHKEQDLPVDRVVLGKYLKLWKSKLHDQEKMNTAIPEDTRERWNGVEITRDISQTLHMDERFYGDGDLEHPSDRPTEDTTTNSGVYCQNCGNQISDPSENGQYCKSCR